MDSSRRPSPYPWTSVERVTRASLQARRLLVEQVDVRAVASRLCAALADWSGQAASFDCRRIVASDAEPEEPIPRLLFRAVHRPLSVLACIDPRLCLRVGQRLAGGREAPVEPLGPIDSSLMGAVAALTSHLIDQAGFEQPLRIGWGRLAEPEAPRVCLEGTLRWGGGAYELALDFELPWSHAEGPQPPVNLTVLGEVPLTLRLVTGTSLLTARQLAELHVGAVYLPGGPPWLDCAGNGEGHLVIEESPWAYPVTLVGARQIVLGPHAVSRDVDPLNPAAGPAQSGAGGLERVLADALLTAHVELGSVTLTAERLARLGPGDVLETPSGLGELAALRVAGHIVAKGELVSIDGQVGLRIVELVTGESK